MTLEELSQVEVTTVSKEPVPAFQTPAAVFVITSEDIRRSGYTRIPDLLRLAPGVEVAQIDSNKWAIGIRGFQGRLSRAVRVLIDGRSVYTPLFAGVYWEMQDTLIEDIDRIEVVRGPGGTIWGANAVNGVINIITKHAKDTRGMLVSAGGGNVEQGFLNWRYGGGSDAFSYRIYGKGFTRGPEHQFPGSLHDDWRMGQIGFRIDWARQKGDTLSFHGDAYSTIAGGRLNISSYTPPAIMALEANAYLSGQNLSMAWNRPLASGSDVQFNAFYDRTDRKDLNFREVRHAVDADFLHRRPLRKHELTVGLGARLSPSRFYQVTPLVDFPPHEQSYNIYSGFAQDKITLVAKRLSLTLGTKLEHNSFSGFEYQPSGRLAYTPTEKQTMWAAVTRAVRTPSRIEDGFLFTALINPALPLYVRLVGDGQFTPEQLVAYEAGYRLLLKSGVVSVSLFHDRYDELLSVESRPPVAETSPPPTRLIIPLLFRNGVQATSSGGEVASLWDLTKWWRIRGAYSYMAMDARRRPGSNDASTVGQLEGDSPRHTGNVRAMFSLPKNLELDLTYRGVSAVTGQRAPAYSTADARFGIRLSSHLSLSLIGRNLLQPSHVEYGGVPGALIGIKRSAYVRLMWSK